MEKRLYLFILVVLNIMLWTTTCWAGDLVISTSYVILDSILKVDGNLHVKSNAVLYTHGNTTIEVSGNIIIDGGGKIVPLRNFINQQTIELKSTGGNITINGLIDMSGTSGLNGANGGDNQDGQDGGNGYPGHNLTLTAAGVIKIGGKITVAGGQGGDGGNGGDDWSVIFGPGAGGDGGDGGNGGKLSISGKAIEFTKGGIIDISAGAGGKGGVQGDDGLFDNKKVYSDGGLKGQIDQISKLVGATIKDTETNALLSEWNDLSSKITCVDRDGIFTKPTIQTDKSKPLVPGLENNPLRVYSNSTNPVIRIIVPEDQGFTDDGVVYKSGVKKIIVEYGEGISINIDCSSIAPGSVVQTALSGLSVGKSSISLKAEDGAENQSTSVTRELIIDTTPPKINNIDIIVSRTDISTYSQVTDTNGFTANIYYNLLDQNKSSAIKVPVSSSWHYDLREYNKPIYLWFEFTDPAGNVTTESRVSASSSEYPVIRQVNTDGTKASGYWIDLEFVSKANKVKGYYIEIYKQNSDGSEQLLISRSVQASSVIEAYGENHTERLYLPMDASPHDSYRAKLSTFNILDVYTEPRNSTPFTFDNNVPVIKVESLYPESGAYINSSTVSSMYYIGIEASDADEDLLTYYLYINNEEKTGFEAITGGRKYSLAKLNDGVYNWFWRVSDGYRTVTHNSRTLIIDRVAPELLVFETPEATTTPILTIDIENYSLELKALKVKYNNVESIPLAMSPTPTITLPDEEGEHTVTLYSGDAAGNWNTGTTFKTILDKTPPPAVSQITTMTGNNSINVNWGGVVDTTTNSTIVSGIEGYIVKYWYTGASEGGESPLLAGTTYTIPNLEANRQVNIQVVARDKAGLESTSTVRSDYTNPGKPTVSASEGTFDHLHPNSFPINLVISALNCATYDIYRYEGEERSLVAEDLSQEVTTYTDYPTAAKTTYKYVVIAKNSASMPDMVSSDLCEVTLSNHAPTVAPTTSGYLHVNNKKLSAMVSDSDGDQLMVTFNIYKYLLDGGKVLYQSINASNNQTPEITLPTDISEGMYEYVVTVTDNDASPVTSIPSIFYIDLTYPSVSCTPGPTIGFTTSQNVELTATDSPANFSSGVNSLMYRWALEGESSDGISYITYSEEIQVPVGRNILHVRVIDNSGNSHTYTYGPYKVDNSNPEITNLTVDNDGVPGYSSGEITVRWNDSDTGSYIMTDYWIVVPQSQSSTIVSIPLTEWENRNAEGTINSITIQENLEDGETYVVGVCLKDAAGHPSNIEITSPIIVDKSAPNVTFTDSTGNPSVSYHISSLAQLTLQATADEPHSRLESLEFALVDNPNTPTITNWASTINEIQGLTDGGVYHLAVKATNILHLSQQVISSIPIYYDSSEPVIESVILGQAAPGTSLYQQKETNNLSFKWQIADEGTLNSLRFKVGSTIGGSEVSIKIEGNQDGWLNIDPAFVGDYVLSNLKLANGQYYLTLEATNMAGLSAQTYSNALTVDDTLPYSPKVEDDGIYQFSTNSIRFTITCTENVEKFQYQILNSVGEPIHDEWLESTVDSSIPSMSIIVNEIDGKPLTLVEGMTYIVSVKGVYAGVDVNGQVITTDIGYSDGITIDSSMPEVVFDDTDFNTTSPHFSWTAIDLQSKIKGMWLAIGTKPEGTEIVNWKPVFGTSQTFVDLSANLVEGQTYYASFKVKNGANNELVVKGDGFIIDTTPAPAPRITASKLFVNSTGQIEYNWRGNPKDVESGNSRYRYDLVTVREWGAVQWKDFSISSPEGISFSTDGLVDGTTYYLALEITNGADMVTKLFGPGVMYDEQCPTSPLIVQSPYQSDTTTLTATFSSNDFGSGIYNYYYKIYTFSPTESDRLILGPLPAANGEMSHSMALTPGNTYYFTVEVLDNALNLSGMSISEGVLIDTSSGPALGIVQDDGEYTANNQQLSFKWTGSYTYTPIDKYQYALTTSNSRPADALFVDASSPAVSISASEFDSTRTTFQEGLANKYYLHVKVVDYQSREAYGVSDGITIDSTPPTIPQIVENRTYVGQTTTFSWVASTDAETLISKYQYALGSVRGGDDITDGWLDVTTTSVNYTNPDLNHQQRIFLKVRAINGAGEPSIAALGDGVVIDATPPSTPLVSGSDYLANVNNFNVKLSSKEGEVKILGYEYNVYNGSAKIATGTQMLTTSVAELSDYVIQIPNPRLEDGKDYIVKVKTLNSVGLWSIEGISGLIRADFTKPDLSFTASGEQITNDGSVSISWNATEKGTLHYRVKYPNGQYVPATGYTDSSVTAEGEQHLGLTFSAAGSYELQMYMVDLAGNRSDSTPVKRVRYNAKPEVSFNTASISGYLGRTIIFPSPLVYDPDGHSTQSYTYSWDFGDGIGISPLGSPEYVYESVNTFTVRVTVTDIDGGTGIASLSVVITNTLAGELHRSETWSGNVILVGTVIVPAGKTLTITPGTTVSFVQDTGLTVHGVLDARGSVENPINFKNAEANTLWKGIYLSEHSSSSQITGITVESAKRGLVLHKQYITVANCTFKNNEIGIHIFDGSPLIHQSIFRENIFYGIKEDGAALPTISFNYFTENGIAPYYHKQNTLLQVQLMNFVNIHWQGNF